MTSTQSKVISLTPEQVHTAAARANTFESFGRAIVSHLLQTASETGMLNAAPSKIPLEATVRSATFEDRDPAVARTVCIDACVGPVCVHVFIE
jgi:hypothetical protein